MRPSSALFLDDSYGSGRRACGDGAALLFPVVGGASYVDDYGDARPQGRHEGNDLMAAQAHAR